MSDTESSSTSILVAQRNDDDTENDSEIDEMPQKKEEKPTGFICVTLSLKHTNKL